MVLGAIKKAVEGFGGNRRPKFDPSTLDDPVAMDTDWGPVKGGGTNMTTHRLQTISPERVEFKLDRRGVELPGVFMVAGVVMMIGMVMLFFTQGDVRSLYFVPFGAIFVVVGFFILRSWMTPRVFDRRLGYYWRGRLEPRDTYSIQQITERCPLDDIYAIQLLEEYCVNSSSNGRSRSFYSYELNLVREDGFRLNVVDHGNRSRIRADAELLAQFLDVPIWDAITRD